MLKCSVLVCSCVNVFWSASNSACLFGDCLFVSVFMPAGDIAVFANHRVLHGREPINMRPGDSRYLAVSDFYKKQIE